MSSLMKHKALITRRKLIITLIIAAMFVVTAATGFSSTPSDNTVYTANGERVVMWEELPESGTPEDYDLLTNLKFAAQKLYTSGYFRGETSGDVVANVGLGIKYTQHVHNMRVVKGDTIFSEAVSSSTLKSVAEQKYHHGDTILFRPSKTVNNDGATFSDEVVKMSTDAFLAAYGSKPNELSSHYIYPSSIISVADDNALTKDAANSDGDNDGEQYPFDVPTTLVADENGNYKFTLVLDKSESTKYYRNEVRTLASADRNPVFYSVSVTVEIDKSWTPLSVTTVENYDIAIPVLGAMNCTSEMVEVFTDVGKTDGEVPEREFFEAHLDAETGDIPAASTSASDYLAAAFASYLDGSKTLDLAANIKINDIAVNDLALSVNIGSPLTVKAKFDPLAIEYAGDRVYLTLNDTKGYVPTDKFVSLISDPAIAALMGGLGELPDFSTLLGDDILATVFADCVMTTTDGVVEIRLPFSLGDIDIDASLFINDGDKSLKSISGNIKAFGLDISLDAKPTEASFPAVDGSYKDLSPALDFIPDAIKLATGTTYGVSGNIDLYGERITVKDLYVDRTDPKDIKLDGAISAGGADISFKLTCGVIYLTLGDIRIKCALNEINGLVNTVTELIGAEKIDLTGSIKNMLPTDISIPDILGMVKSISASSDTLAVTLNADSTPISLSLTRGGGKIGVTAAVKNADIDLSAALELSDPAKRTVAVSEADAAKYITPDDILNVVEPIMDTVGDIKTAKTIKLDLAGALGKTNIAAENMTIALGSDDGDGLLALSASLVFTDIDVALEITFTDGVAYIRLGNLDEYGVMDSEHNIAVKLDTAADMETIKTVLSHYLPDYLTAELDNLFSSNSGFSLDSLGTIGKVINRFVKLAKSPTPENIVGGLFGELEKGKGDSAVKYILDRVAVVKSADGLVVTAKAFGMDITLTPVLSENGQKLAAAVASVSKQTENKETGVVTTNSIGTLRIDIADISKTATTVTAPEDEFVPLVDFVELIDNLIGTFTTATGSSADNLLNGSILQVGKPVYFEIPEITSDNAITYEKKATKTKKVTEIDATTGKETTKTVAYFVDANGDEITNESYATLADKIVITSPAGKSLLLGRVEKTESGTDINLEAHVKLDIQSLAATYQGMTIDLYVTDGTAYLRYTEGNGYGETISIDYDSVMQILASVMRIMGVDPSIVHEIFKENDQNIDTSVFKSMQIAGLESIQKTVQSLADAILSLNNAFGELQKAWKIVTDSKSIAELGTKTDDLKSHLNAALSAVKGINLGSSGIKVDNDLFKRVIGGIKLGVTTDDETHEKHIYANVNNSLTLGDAPVFEGTPEHAKVYVTQTNDREKNVVKGIKIEDLDVRTARINGGITFNTGDEVDENAFTIPVANGENADKRAAAIAEIIAETDTVKDDTHAYEHMYSDLSNIKHLLYDVMNTANMLEFEIGGADGATNGTIHIDMTLLGFIEGASFDILYSAKVKIFTKDELKAIGLPVKDSDPALKTVAYVELTYENCKALGITVIPNCQTRLYFFDDMLYVHGVKITPVYGGWFNTLQSMKTEYVDVMYTAKQFTDMLSAKKVKKADGTETSGLSVFLEEFLFYLVPMSRCVKVILVNIDIQNIIIENVTNPEKNKTDMSNKTIAKIFKQYNYGPEKDGDDNITGYKHDITIGLKELAGSSALGDLDVTLRGANDGDDNLLDNYISSASIGTKIAVTGVSITIGLDAHLNNVDTYTEDGVDKIRSSWTDDDERAFLSTMLTETIPDTSWTDIWNGYTIIEEEEIAA